MQKVANLRTTKVLFLFIFILFPCISSAYSHQSLNAFINSVLEHNPAIQAAKANVCATKSREHASHQPLYNPELTADGQEALENTASVGINQTIDWTNKRGARGQVGAANAQVAEAQLVDLQQQMAVQILSALSKYQAEREAIILAKERTSLLQKFVDLTKKRYTEGDIARIDLDLAQLALSEALTQEATTEVNANQALQILRAITGCTEMDWPRLPSILPTLTLKKIKIDDLINELPSVIALDHQYRAAFSRLKLAERERYPDPTIGVRGGTSWSEGERKKLIGISLNIPLFIRNPYKAEVDAASYDAMQADEKRLDIVRQASAEIRNSAERYQTLYRAMHKWQEVSGKPLSDGMTLIERLWQAGEINTTDYIVQLKQRVDSQIAGVELKGRVWQAWADWLRASGEVECWLHLKH
jgi:cobalt-zinc-cadmium efflux system outer membrane protein